MTRRKLHAPILIWLLLSVIVGGCSRGPAPAATPAPTATPTSAPGQPCGSGRTWTPPMNMQPVVKGFLADLPEAWGLLPAQAFAAKKTFLVDVRQPDEYQQGFIEGAINIPLRELTRNLGALPGPDQPVTLVCDTGARAAIGMTTLQMLGWKQARSIYGGLRGWQEAKFTVVTAPAPKRPTNQPPKIDAQLLAALDGYLNEGLPQNYGRIDPEGLARAQAQTPFEELVDPEVWVQGPAYLIDVSEPAEFSKSGSIAKAVNMPLRTIPDNLSSIPWETPTVVVCGIENHLTTLDRTYKYIVTVCPNGHRSAVAMMVFQLLGFRDVHALEGGLKAWKAAGH